uniref:hypothetical protein n=1 Tax=Agathobacter sp. TaxID=2021311 RepID=UPI00405669BE
MVDNYVSIKDLFAELVRKAGIIIIGMLAGAVLLTAVKYVLDVRNQASHAELETDEVSVEQVVESLSEREKNALGYYIAQLKIYRQQQEYMEESIYFNLDAGNVCATNMQYFISSQTAEKTDNIVTMYNNYLKNGGLFADLCTHKEEWKPEYLAEIIKVEGGDTEDYNYPSVINITVYHQTAEDTRDIVLRIKDAVKTFKRNLADIGLSHELELAEESAWETSSNSISLAQKDYINNHKLLGTELETLKEELSGNQLFLADTLLDMEAEEAEDEAVTEEEAEEAETPTKVSLSKKYAVLGAVLGIVFAAGIIICGYIFTATIKTKEEIRLLFHIPKLGTMELKEKTRFEKLADKVFYKNGANLPERELKLLTSKISNFDEMKEVVFVGTVSPLAEKHVNEMLAALAKQQVCAKHVKDICNDAEDFVIAKNAGKVVFLETLRKSENAEVSSKIMLCKEQDIEVLGYIVFDA